MFWSLSFQLLPDEEIIDDSGQQKSSGIKAAYSVFLTNKRAIFRFDGLGSSLTQSFFYGDIVHAEPCKRIFVNYIRLKTNKREIFLNIADPKYWSKKILHLKHEFAKPFEELSPPAAAPSRASEKRELLDMLTVLRKKSLLSEKELDEKIKLLDSMEF